MSQTFDRAKSRLNNIRAIEPLLGALSTLSMGSWQLALNKIAHMQQYEAYFDQILLEILPKIEQKGLRKRRRSYQKIEIADTILLIVGTERGLCGKFNKILIQNVKEFIDQQSFPSHQVWAMGSRMIRELERMGVNVSWRKPLPASELTSYQESYLITQNWLEQYESYAFNHLIILFNQSAKGSGYQFTKFTLFASPGTR